jgi:hypothetical protein
VLTKPIFIKVWNAVILQPAIQWDERGHTKCLIGHSRPQSSKAKGMKWVQQTLDGAEQRGSTWAPSRTQKHGF